MPTLVIKSLPETLHAKLKQSGATNRRSVPQQSIQFLESALAAEKRAGAASGGQSKRANRNVLPDDEAMLASGAFSGGTDSTEAISEERDAR